MPHGIGMATLWQHNAITPDKSSRAMVSTRRSNFQVAFGHWMTGHRNTCTKPVLLCKPPKFIKVPHTGPCVGVQQWFHTSLESPSGIPDSGYFRNCQLEVCTWHCTACWNGGCTAWNSSTACGHFGGQIHKASKAKLD